MFPAMYAPVQKRIEDGSIIALKPIHITPGKVSMNSPHQPGCPSAFSRRAGISPQTSAHSLPLPFSRTGTLYGRNCAAKHKTTQAVSYYDAVQFCPPYSNNALTAQLVRDYSVPVTAKSVTGIGLLSNAAMSRNVLSNAAFLRLVSPSMGGLDGEPKGSPVRVPGTPTRLVPPTRLASGVRLNILNGERIMSNIIPVVSRIFRGKPTQAVNAKNFYSFLSKSQSTRFNDWITRRISEYGFVEGDDFLTEESKTKGRPGTEYYLTIDMAKELAMVERTEKGREARRYFIECEKQLKEKQQTKIAPKALPNPEKKRYNYPRHLLEQEHFISPTRPARLSISMLGDEKEFSSSLLELLLELGIDGHNVDAPYAEYIAMREGLIKARRALDEIMETALRANVKPASTASN